MRVMHLNNLAFCVMLKLITYQLCMVFVKFKFSPHINVGMLVLFFDKNIDNSFLVEVIIVWNIDSKSNEKGSKNNEIEC